MGLSLHYHGHSHTDSKKENINVRAALIHIIGDFIQSFGVLVAALIIFFKVFSLIFFIVKTIGKNSTLNIF